MNNAPETSPPLVMLGRKAWGRCIRMLRAKSVNPRFRRAYMVGAVLVLFATTLLWAVLGARLQLHNADQLSDPYMFSSWATFHAASFPGSHTFLLKWPIFWLVGALGVSATNLLIATVAVVLVTVATLAYILYRIDRRPLVFGTVCLGVALALLLVPAQPYVGGVLPVNMAMLTTRNLEYAVYLAALLLFAGANRLRSRSFALGVVLLALLIASDKLFLSLSAGGALLALLAYALFSNWPITTFVVRWLAGSLMAAVGATALLLVISASHLTHLVNSTAAAPYGVVHSAQSVMLGIVYAGAGVLTNVGANSAYDSTILRQLPGALIDHLWSYSGIAYLVAAGLLVYALRAVWQATYPTLKSVSGRSRPPAANLFALSLVWSSVAAIGVFVMTNHYYAVDARYLSICFFALVVTVSVRLRSLQWQWAEDLLLIGGGLLVALVIAAFTALHVYTKQTAVFHTVNDRNASIVTALKNHKVDVLVGDYWRVLPIKLASQGELNVTPLANCTQPTNILTSGAWQPNLHNHSFAYLVTLDGSLTDYPACTLAQITAKYGTQNATEIIAGTSAKPAEALLFYDQGSRMPRHPTRQVVQAPVLPVSIDALPDTGCDQPTVMNIVAHQDDDLLFMSPDLLHNIQSGHCVRTVYLTAGDAGLGKFYWLGRQLGAEAAYGSMLGTKAAWDQKTVLLAPNEYATVASPRGNPKISLVFLNLPDGYLQGEGFPVDHSQSLAKLYDGNIRQLRSVDDQSRYTSSQLVAALVKLMNTYQPAAIHTQADVPSANYPDHSDHITTGLYALAAAAQYNQTHFGGELSIPVTRYIGYPIHGYDSNVAGTDLVQKEAAFLAYGQYDGGVCHSIGQCMDGTTVYGFYLERQYQQ